MAEELLIDVSEFETRVGLLSNNVLQDVHINRSGTYSLTGNVYKGKVDRILPGLQAAFVDVGLSRPGFLHARDIEVPTVAPGEEVEIPDIRDVLHQGQILLVQVAKDPFARKGARLTANLTFAGRFMVFMPGSDHIGVSRRIDDEDERELLREEALSLREELGIAGGFIIRTAAENVTRKQMGLDMVLLKKVWSRIEKKSREAPVRELVYEDLPVHMRVIRDFASSELTAVLVNDADTHRRVEDYVRESWPQLIGRVRLYDQDLPLFERFGAENELQRCLSKEVKLRSGGYLVIEQTEAMTTIDVNTGTFLGTKNLEETAFWTNLEAATVIPRELRLRNIGGIIVIDFIDMEEENHQSQVMRELEDGAKGDPARIRLIPFSDLGLVELSRKRTRKSMAQLMCEPCVECSGHGLVKTPQTVCYEIFRDIKKEALERCSKHELGEYMVRASSAVVDRLLNEDADHLAFIVRDIGRMVKIQVEPSFGAEDFDVMLVHDVQSS